MLANWMLDTPLIVIDGMTESEINEEWERCVARSKMTQQLIDGHIDWETYLDFMIEQGYEPADLLDAAEENLEFAQDEGLVLTK